MPNGCDFKIPICEFCKIKIWKSSKYFFLIRTFAMRRISHKSFYINVRHGVSDTSYIRRKSHVCECTAITRSVYTLQRSAARGYMYEHPLDNYIPLTLMLLGTLDIF